MGITFFLSSKEVLSKLVFFPLLFLLTPALKAQTDSSYLILQHVNIIDGISKKALLDQTIIVQNGKITVIKKNISALPSTALVIDLSGKWLLPGYIDAHVHFGTRKAAQTALSTGVTTARSMNTFHYFDVELREANKGGATDVPAVLAAGYQIRPDMFDAFFKDFPALSDLKPKIQGAENVRRAIRANLERKVNWIKILATERAGTPETDPRKRTFTDEELLAIVDEAGKSGVPVAAHAHGDEGAYKAVQAGVRTLEHGTYLSDKTLQLMKQKGTYLVITNALYGAMDSLPMIKNNPIMVERQREMYKQAMSMTKLAYKKGVSIVAGTDSNYEMVPGLTIAKETALLVEAGLSPMDAIKAITSRAAQALQIETTGVVKGGLDADFVLLAANPLEDISALQEVEMVINNGKIVVNKLK